MDSQQTFDLKAKFSVFTIDDEKQIKETELHLNQIANNIIESNSLEALLSDVVKIRQLSTTGADKIESIVNCNSKLFPKLIDLLNNSDDNPKFQFEITWIFLNVCAGTFKQTKYVVDLDVLGSFKRILAHSKDQQLLIQVLWCIRNISDDDALNQLVFVNGLFDSLLLLLGNIDKTSTELGKQIATTFCNMIINGKHKFSIYNSALPWLNRFINSNDPEIVNVSCKAMNNILCAENDSAIEKTLSFLHKHNPGPRLIEIVLTSSDETTIESAMVNIGDILSSSQEHVMYLLQCNVKVGGGGVVKGPAGLLNAIEWCFSSSNPLIRKAATWALSNLAVEYPQLLIDHHMLDNVIHNLLVDQDMDVRVEAIWVINNVLESSADVSVLKSKMPQITHTLSNELSKKEIKDPLAINAINFIIDYQSNEQQ